MNPQYPNKTINIAWLVLLLLIQQMVFSIKELSLLVLEILTICFITKSAAIIYTNVAVRITELGLARSLCLVRICALTS